MIKSMVFRRKWFVTKKQFSLSYSLRVVLLKSFSELLVIVHPCEFKRYHVRNRAFKVLFP